MQGISSTDLEHLSETRVEYDTQPNDAYQTGYCDAKSRLLPHIEKLETDIQMLVEECNRRGAGVEAADVLNPSTLLLRNFFMSNIGVLIGMLEKPESASLSLHFEDKSYPFPTMLKMMREFDPIAVRFACNGSRTWRN